MISSSAERQGPFTVSMAPHTPFHLFRRKHKTIIQHFLKYSLIEKNHKKLKQLIKDKIISININDKVKNSLRDLFTEKYLIYPRFLFYWDSQLLCATITGGVDKIITFADLKPRSSWSSPNL